MSWSLPFEPAIPLPDGRQLSTLRDAGQYITKLPKAKQKLPHWQTAAEVVLIAAEKRGPVMHARIGMLKALNHGKPKPTVERRKAVKKYRIVR